MKTLSIALSGAIWLVSAQAFGAGAPTAKKMTQAEANAACKAAAQGSNAGGVAAYMPCVHSKMAGQD